MTTAPEHAARWTPERIETLMVLWDEGKSARNIADALGGGVSRNGVLGKVHRLGLPPHLTFLNMRKSMVKNRERRAKMRSHEKRGRTTPRRNHHAPNPSLPPPMPIPAWDALPGSTPIGIMELSHDTCRWPIGEEPFRFCGCAPTSGSSYCGSHHALATRVIA